MAQHAPKKSPSPPLRGRQKDPRHPNCLQELLELVAARSQKVDPLSMSGKCGTSKVFCTVSTPAPVVAQQRARQQPPKNCTCGISPVFCKVCTVGARHNCTTRRSKLCRWTGSGAPAGTCRNNITRTSTTRKMRFTKPCLAGRRPGRPPPAAPAPSSHLKKFRPPTHRPPPKKILGTMADAPNSIDLAVSLCTR